MFENFRLEVSRQYYGRNVRDTDNKNDVVDKYILGSEISLIVMDNCNFVTRKKTSNMDYILKEIYKFC